jgi:hypothetical protein
LEKKDKISKKPKAISPKGDLAENILNSSRSMLSIINRNYIYEKVNEAFCNAHKAGLGGIVGKSLPEVWGESTFVEKIKNNIDSCFRGNI